MNPPCDNQGRSWTCSRLTPILPTNLAQVGASRCDVPARETAGGTLAPLNAARTAQRAIPTYLVQVPMRVERKRPSPGRKAKGALIKVRLCGSYELLRGLAGISGFVQCAKNVL